MSKNLMRRGFLHSVAAALTIVAFDPVAKAFSAQPGQGFIPMPNFQGALLLDSGSVGSAADDFGHIVHHTSWAVLVPASAHDIAKAIKFARKQGLKVAAARGIGESHSTYGQAQVEAGIVIDMSALNEIHEVNCNNALVDAGVRWNELLAVTVPLGKSPPVLTDYIDLSVGGTLSVGGIGGQASKYGLQVDNVLELEVVTGEGKVLKCSPHQHADLFNAMRCGFGQFGIIVRARVKLADIAPMARTYKAIYTDISVFTADQMMLVDDERFDYVEGFASPANGGGWSYELEAVKYYSPASPPDDNALLAGLSFVPGSVSILDQSYFDFANRLAPTIAFLQSIGVWGLPHPWTDMFVPGTQAASFIGGVLAQTSPADVNGPILIYPFRTAKSSTPFLMLPDDQHTFLFSILRTALPPTPENVANLVAQNRSIYDQLVGIEGKRYPIGSIEVTQADWQDHFGSSWGDFEGAKEDYDPDHVLAPGQKIFVA